MNDSDRENLNLNELCKITFMPKSTIIDIVEHGIVEPSGDEPETWLFDVHMIVTTRKALRLHRDLEINWSGIAFALMLIDEMEQLREERSLLRMQLNRFKENSDTN